MSFIDARDRAFPHATRLIATLSLLVSIGYSSSASAKDLYVAPSGNDGVSYASNSISAPWKTIDHGLYNLKAGDHLYIRGGTYTPRYPVWLGTDYNRQTKGGDPNETLNSESGTASSPVIIESYQGEQVTVDLGNIGGASTAYVNLDGKSYWTFRGLTFINSLMVFKVGEDRLTEGSVFEKLNVTANRGGDNVAAIHIWGSNGENTTIRNCILKGPGQNVHANTGTIYVKGVNRLKILNNVLSNAPIGIYYKHRNTATSAGQASIEIAYNYITNTTRASLEYNASFSSIHDNITGVNTAPMHFGDANGAAGADYNKIEHNTFLSGSIRFDSAVDSSDPFPGVVGNSVVNNIVLQPIEVMLYRSVNNTNTIGKNLFASSGMIDSYNDVVRMSADSIIGAPTFTGGSAPSTISGFALASGSRGENAGTDGRDMGADVSRILSGQPSAPPPTDRVPNPPSDVSVE